MAYPLAGVLCGLAFAAPLQAYAATIEVDRGQLSYLNRFVVTPMAFLAGTYYPLAALPAPLQWLGWASPMWHGSELARVLNHGHAEPLWLTPVHVAVLVAFVVSDVWLARRVFEARLTGTRARRSRPARALPRPVGAGDARSIVGDPETVAAAEERIRRLRTRRWASRYSGNIAAVVGRGLSTLRGAKWGMVLAGFLEPVLYLLAMGVGVGALVGKISDPQYGTLGYLAFLAPALLATSAMNGALSDTTWAVFRKVQHVGTYRVMAHSPLGAVDIVFGEIIVALVRSVLYATGFLVVIRGFGLEPSAWGWLPLPAAVLVAFAFAALGMAITTALRTPQQMRLLLFWVLPMFLFSGSLFPITAYPEALQAVVAALPLWHAIAMMRDLTYGTVDGWTAVHAGYFVALSGAALAVTIARFRRLFFA